MINYRNRPPRGAGDNSDVIEKENVQSPPTQPYLPVSRGESDDDLFDKKRAAHFLRISVPTFDRARTKKRKGLPGYELFPADYRPSGDERGHLRFRRTELIRWRDRDTPK